MTAPPSMDACSANAIKLPNNILISAILPTFNRATYLKIVLKSLLMQSLPNDNFELVVTNDGSFDETGSILENAKNEFKNIKIITQERRGIAVAKNEAIARASAPLILFLDDDDVADTNLLEQHIKAHCEHPRENVVILGHTGIEASIADACLMRYVTESGCQLFSYPHLSPEKVLSYREFWGGRSSCKRSLLEYEKFNPDFTFGCEDIELAWRLRENLEVRYVPTARTTMMRNIRFGEFCDRSYRQGRAQSHFAALYPDASEIQEYCEIEKARRYDFSCAEAVLAYTSKLDLASELYRFNGRPIKETRFEAALWHNYHRSFELCRYQGIVANRSVDGSTRAPDIMPSSVISKHRS